MLISRAVLVTIAALLMPLLEAGSASAATDHVVITGGAVVAPEQTAGDVVVIDGPVTIAGHATGDVVSVSGPIRLTGRIDGDLIAVSDRALLGPRARVGGDLRYGDERPVLAPGARAVAERLGATIGWGVAIAIGAPLLAILALVTLVGIPFGIGLLLAAIPVLLVAYTTTAWVLGRRVLRDRSQSPWAALLAGWGILRVLALIPVVGGLVGLVATLVGLGALAVALWRAHTPSAPAALEPGRPAVAA